MRHLGVHVGPEAIFVVGQLLPERDRTLFRELDADDRLDALEAVLPRRREPERRAILLVDRLAVEAGGDEGKVVRRLVDRQPLGVGPGIKEILLARHDRGLAERLHDDVLGASGGLAELDQRLHREARPRHDHRPGLDAAVAIDTLLELHLGQQVVEADLERLVDQPAHLNGPGPDRQLLRLAPDALVAGELVVVVVGRGQPLGRDGRGRAEFVAARGRVAAG